MADIVDPSVVKPPAVNLGSLRIFVKAASQLRSADINGKSDPFCVVKFKAHEKKKDKKTEVKEKTLNPVWNETFDFKITDQNFVNGAKLKFKLYDKDLIGEPEDLGSCKLEIPKDFWSTKDFTLPIEYHGKHKGDLSITVARVSHFKVGGPGQITPWNKDGPFEEGGWEMKFSVDADGTVSGRNKNDGESVSKKYLGTLKNGHADITVNFSNGQVSRYTGTIIPGNVAEIKIVLVTPAKGAHEAAGAYKLARGVVKVNAK